VQSDEEPPGSPGASVLSTAYQTSTIISSPSSLKPKLITKGLDATREKIIQFFSARHAFETKHTERQGKVRSLGAHLLGTYDILNEACCTRAVCIAGALHSVYGTNKFKTITLNATPKHRSEIIREFGFDVERLMFLFHICTRPYDINSGILTERFGQPDVTVGQGRPKGRILVATTLSEVQSLRLIEAANLLDQGSDITRWSTIQQVWNQQVATSMVEKALAQPHESKTKANSKHGFGRHLRRLPRKEEKVINVQEGNRTMFLPCEHRLA